MPVSTECPHCRAPVRFPDGFAATHARCPSCKGAVPAPVSLVAVPARPEDAKSPDISSLVGIVSFFRAIIWIILGVWVLYLTSAPTQSRIVDGELIRGGVGMPPVMILSQSVPGYILARCADKVLLAILGR